jgi:hypothetical protein
VKVLGPGLSSGYFTATTGAARYGTVAHAVARQ